jgi:GDP-4-dehydro-6-deoxy-D-mannose reductase
MKKALITGITGFAGGYLADELLDNGYEVAGTYLSDDSLSNFPLKDKVKLHKIDLLDEVATHKLIEEEKPDFLFHLAALTSPRASFDDPKGTFVNNVSGEINILESVKKLGLKDTKILIISSAEVYGAVSPKDLPIDENTPFKPSNPYAVSKIAQDFLGLQYYLSDNLQIIRVRPFNHIGPRQAPSFVVSAFAKRIVGVERGEEEVMKVGNLSSRKDFTSVQDIVRAYRLALEKGVPGEVYNLGSGKSYAISEILDMMIGLAKGKIEVEQDPDLMKPADDTQYVCDYSKFNKLTGWTPQIPIEKTIQDTLDYWRSQN